MSLLVKGFLYLLLFMFFLLPFYLRQDIFLLIIKKPILFFLGNFLHFNILSPVIIYILHQVDSSLIFLSPLVLSEFPLFFTLKPCEVFNQLFLSFLIFSLLEIVLLQINNFLSSFHLFFLLNSFKFLFFCESLVKHFSISIFFNF